MNIIRLTWTIIKIFTINYVIVLGLLFIMTVLGYYSTENYLAQAINVGSFLGVLVGGFCQFLIRTKEIELDWNKKNTGESYGKMLIIAAFVECLIFDFGIFLSVTNIGNFSNASMKLYFVVFQFCQSGLSGILLPDLFNYLGETTYRMKKKSQTHR